jgi:Rap1a immunity proteins
LCCASEIAFVANRKEVPDLIYFHDSPLCEVTPKTTRPGSPACSKRKRKRRSQANGVVAMKQLLLVLGLFGVLAHSLLPAHAVESPYELARQCEALKKGAKGSGRALTIPRSRGPLLCWGYMQAVQDLGEFTDEDGRRLAGFCPPQGSRLSDLIRAFLNSRLSRSADANANTLLAVIKALQEAYPCPERQERAKP